MTHKILKIRTFGFQPFWFNINNNNDNNDNDNDNNDDDVCDDDDDDDNNDYKYMDSDENNWIIDGVDDTTDWLEVTEVSKG